MSDPELQRAAQFIATHAVLWGVASVAVRVSALEVLRRRTGGASRV